MKIPMTVTMEDGSKHDIETRMVDIVALERAAGASAPHIFEGKIKEMPMVEAQARLAWLVCKRRGFTTLGFDAWLDIADVESTEVAPASPLESPPSTG